MSRMIGSVNECRRFILCISLVIRYSKIKWNSYLSALTINEINEMALFRNFRSNDKNYFIRRIQDELNLRGCNFRV